MIDRPEQGGPVLHQAVRFGIVGVANTLVTYLVIRALHEGLGVALAIASGLGYAVGVVQSFLVNRAWTFSAAGGKAPAGQALRFIGVNLVCGLLFSVVVTNGEPRIGMEAATLLAVAFTTVIGFILNRSFVFRA